MQNFLSLIAVRYHGEYEWQDPKSEDEVVNIVFINKEGKHIPIRGKVGDNKGLFSSLCSPMFLLH